MKPLSEQLRNVSAAAIEEARRKTIVGPTERPSFQGMSDEEFRERVGMDTPRFVERGRTA